MHYFFRIERTQKSVGAVVAEGVTVEEASTKALNKARDMNPSLFTPEGDVIFQVASIQTIPTSADTGEIRTAIQKAVHDTLRANDGFCMDCEEDRDRLEEHLVAAMLSVSGNGCNGNCSCKTSN